MLSLTRQAFRSWKNNKGAAALAAIALSIGIGSTTAIYTIVNSVLLKPVAYKSGERFVSLFSANTSNKSIGSSNLQDLLAYRERTHSFDAFGWFSFANFNLTAPGNPQHISGVEVTPSLVESLGVNPIMGRWFGEDAAEGNAAVAVISYSLWQKLGGGKNVLNIPITLNGRVYQVIGVMPEPFRLPHTSPGGSSKFDVWVPLDRTGRGRSPDWGGYFCYARLKPGMPYENAVADVKRVAAEIAKEQPGSHPKYTARLIRLQEMFSEDIRPTLLLLFAATAMLLLITCANVAGLLVARSVARARETAIAVALGAGRMQLALQYFMEGLFVSLLGAAGGVLLALVLLRVSGSYLGDMVPRFHEVALDWSGLLFALSAAFLASALSSMAPLWQAFRTHPNEVLSEGVRASAAKKSRGLSQSLVAGEIALAFTLLTVSALLITQLRNMTKVPPGFDPNHLHTFELSTSETDFAGKENRQQYQKRLVLALKSIPGVESAGFVNQLPLSGCCYTLSIYSDSGENLTRSDKLSFMTASPEYLRTMRIPMRSGRFLSEQEKSEDPMPVVINEAAAARYYPNRNPIGATGRFSEKPGPRFEVVGVTGNVRNDGLASSTVPEIYLSGYNNPPNPMHFVVRSDLPTATLFRAIRQTILQVNPLQPLDQFTPMDEVIQTSLFINRASSFLMAFFAFAALLMAVLGVYGLVSYNVRQRTVEIGTRMALGAEGSSVLSLVVGSGMKLAGFGIALGSLLVTGAVWILQREFKLGQLEILPFLLPALITLTIVATASLVPAYRATRLSPMVAIRNEAGSRWQRPLTKLDDRPVVATSEVLAEFSEASRHADSFSAAIHSSLETMRQKLGAQSAMLFQSDGLGHLECAEAKLTLPADGLLVHRLKHFPAPLPIAIEDVDTWKRWSAENLPANLPEVETLENSGARLAVALRDKSGITGMILLGAPVVHDSYNRLERQVLQSCAEHFALMIQNGKLTDRVVLEEKMRRDLELAVEVQRRLLPQSIPTSSVAKLSGMSLPARSVGGDYYDFLEVGSGRVGIVIADIAGKGIAAALVMSVVQASLRLIALESDITLPQLASKMNRYLYRSTGTNSYATFFYGQIDEKTGLLNYVNAGHNPPYLMRAASGEIEELPAGGTVIGLFPEMKYAESAVKLDKGDVLIAFTDGVTEALNPEDEEFGEDRLKDVLRQVRHLPVEEMTPVISAELQKWIQHAEQYDDLTFLLLKVS